MSLIPEANIAYNSKKEVIKQYQKKVIGDVADEEQDWADQYLAVLIDFMGDEDVWKTIVPDVVVKGSGGRASSRGERVTDKPYAAFSGAHWTSKKASERVWFDPYDHYQIYGTNQFCQTFAMMNLTDSLPYPEPDGWKRYYKYTKDALDYIKNCVQVYNFEDKNDEKEIKKALRVCRKNSNACVNIIEFPNF